MQENKKHIVAEDLSVGWLWMLIKSRDKQVIAYDIKHVYHSIKKISASKQQWFPNDIKCLPQYKENVQY